MCIHMIEYNLNPEICPFLSLLIMIYQLIAGRHEEIKTIKKVFQKLKMGFLSSDKVTVVEGEAGVGKTRLLEEFLDEAQHSQLRAIHLEGELSRSQSSRYFVSMLANSVLQVDDIERSKYIMKIIQSHSEELEHIGLLHDLLGTHVIQRNSMTHVIQ